MTQDEFLRHICRVGSLLSGRPSGTAESADQRIGPVRTNTRTVTEVR